MQAFSEYNFLDEISMSTRKLSEKTTQPPIQYRKAHGLPTNVPIKFDQSDSEVCLRWSEEGYSKCLELEDPIILTALSEIEKILQWAKIEGIPPEIKSAYTKQYNEIISSFTQSARLNQ
jgi:hypothetical protein